MDRSIFYSGFSTIDFIIVQLYERVVYRSKTRRGENYKTKTKTKYIRKYYIILTPTFTLLTIKEIAILRFLSQPHREHA